MNIKAIIISSIFVLLIYVFLAIPLVKTIFKGKRARQVAAIETLIFLIFGLVVAFAGLG